MPRALAIETSGSTGSIALVESNKVLAEETFSHGLKHAATILPIIDRLTRDRGWKPTEIRQLYVSAGPGSFTGLRIAITLAKTLAFATGAKIVAVPSAQVIARNAPAEAREIIVVLDAKRGQIFAARYTRTAGADLIETEAAHLDTLATMLNRAARPVHVIGEGIPCHKLSIPDDPQIIVTSESTWPARAAEAAKIGIEMAGRGEFADAHALTPIYVRLPEPEEKRLAAERGSAASPSAGR